MIANRATSARRPAVGDDPAGRFPSADTILNGLLVGTVAVIVALVVVVSGTQGIA